MRNSCAEQYCFSSPQGTVLLSDGRLLVEQFGTNHWWLVSPDSSGNYAKPSIVPAHDSYYIHEYSGLALLKDGEVMVSGAEYPQPGDSNYDPATTGVDRIEIYNPAVNSWRVVAKPAFFGDNVITDNSIKVLPDGKVLASTGNSAIYGLYDPVTNTWTQTQSIPSGSSNEVTLTMLNSGLVLAVGTGTAGDRSWVFDESTGTWTEVGQTPGMLNTGEGGPMVQLPGGDILAVGAVPHWLTQTAIYSPATQTWNPAAPIPNGSEGQAADASTTLLDQTFRLVPRLAPDLALEVQNGSSVNFTPVDVGTWSQADQQVWQLQDAGGGDFTLVPSNATGSALDDQYGASADGNPVDLYQQNGTGSERWNVTPTGDGYFTLSPESAPGSSLQVSQGATTLGSQVVIDTTNGSPAQEWQLIQSPNTSFGDEPLAALPNGDVLTAVGRINQTAFYEYNPVSDRWTSVSGVPEFARGRSRGIRDEHDRAPLGPGARHGGRRIARLPLHARWRTSCSLEADGHRDLAGCAGIFHLMGFRLGSERDQRGGSLWRRQLDGEQLPPGSAHGPLRPRDLCRDIQLDDHAGGPQLRGVPVHPSGQPSLRRLLAARDRQRHRVGPGDVSQRANHSGQGLTSGAIYELVPEDNLGLALTSGGAGKAGTSPWSGLASQRWEILDAGGGLFTVVPINAPRKLLGAPDALGQPVTVGKADGTAAQKWTITPSGDGFYDLSPQSNPLATLGDGSPAPLVIDAGAISQRWRLVPVDTIADGLYRLSPWNRRGKALTVQGTVPPDLTPSSVTPWRGRAGQEWDLTNVGGGYVTLTPLNAPGSRLEVLSGSTSPGATTGIGPVSASSNAQEWLVSLNANGSFRLVPSSAAELSLDSRAIAHGATMPVQVNGSNGSRTQEWSLQRLAVADPPKASRTAQQGPHHEPATSVAKTAPWVSWPSPIGRTRGQPAHLTCVVSLWIVTCYYKIL